MLAHPGANGNPSPSAEWHVPEALAQFHDLQALVLLAAREGTAAHQVERSLFRGLLQLGATLLAAFFKLVGPGDLGPTATLGDGRTVRRLGELHTRRLLTVFGPFQLARHVYAQRPGQRLELIPTDQRLALPEAELSYLLQEFDQLLGVQTPFGAVRDTLEMLLGFKQSADTLERNSRQMAQAALAFRQAQPPVDPDEEKELLVVSDDNKGVPMVRPVEQRPVGAHRKKGEKANKKQMACLGCVYSVGPNVRTPEEVVALLFREGPKPLDKPPEAQQKRYWAELSREVDGQKVRGQDRVFEQLAAEVRQRRKEGQVLIHLSDGQKTLEEDRHKYLPTDEKTVDILELLHVTPRLWQAAHLFFKEGSEQASAFVRERLLEVLKGNGQEVVEGLRQLGQQRQLKGSKAKRLKGLTGFLEGNQHRMRYDEYLEAGYPIATGVIEGACRHLVKDRMERAGMRWKVPGALAMLQLRAIHTNGDWEPFQSFRFHHETARLYPHSHALDAIAWPLALAA
jgi:hypothetical protein